MASIIGEAGMDPVMDAGFARAGEARCSASLTGSIGSPNSPPCHEWNLRFPATAPEISNPDFYICEQTFVSTYRNYALSYVTCFAGSATIAPSYRSRREGLHVPRITLARDISSAGPCAMTRNWSAFKALSYATTLSFGMPML